MNTSSTIIGLAKKFIWVFPNILWKNSNNLLSQPIICRPQYQKGNFNKVRSRFYFSDQMNVSYGLGV